CAIAMRLLVHLLKTNSEDQVLEIVFFFQAEDGIRDATVTGVQTCALPIYLQLMPQAVADQMAAMQQAFQRTGVQALNDLAKAMRSEERRVGKECSSRGTRSH